MANSVLKLDRYGDSITAYKGLYHKVSYLVKASYCQGTKMTNGWSFTSPYWDDFDPGSFAILLF